MIDVFSGISELATAPEFQMQHLDVSHLTGHSICLFSDQFPGKQINCRVANAKKSDIELNIEQSESVIANLVNNQTVVVLFPFDDQDIAVKAILRKKEGGRTVLHLDKKAMPLSQRNFERFKYSVNIKLATYPFVGSRPPNLTELHWIGTDSINLSGGGALIVLPGFLNEGVMVLLHLDAPSVTFPKILLGQIRHCYQLAESRHVAGVEFITKDIGQNIVPLNRKSILPASVFEFTNLERERIDRELRLGAPKISRRK